MESFSERASKKLADFESSLETTQQRLSKNRETLDKVVKAVERDEETVRAIQQRIDGIHAVMEMFNDTVDTSTYALTTFNNQTKETIKAQLTIHRTSKNQFLYRVHQNSVISATLNEDVPQSVRTARSESEFLDNVLQEDVTFASLHSATAFVLGVNINNTQLWRDKNNNSPM